MTLREMIEKAGDKILDMPIAFRIYDGHLNSDYSAAPKNFSYYAFTVFDGRKEDGWPGELRFNIGLSENRLVKERKK
jgi:hypothetical protein